MAIMLTTGDVLTHFSQRLAVLLTCVIDLALIPVTNHQARSDNTVCVGALPIQITFLLVIVNHQYFDFNHISK